MDGIEHCPLPRDEQTAKYGRIAIDCHGCRSVYLADREPVAYCPHCGFKTVLDPAYGQTPRPSLAT